MTDSSLFFLGGLLAAAPVGEGAEPSFPPAKGVTALLAPCVYCWALEAILTFNLSSVVIWRKQNYVPPTNE